MVHLIITAAIELSILILFVQVQYYAIYLCDVFYSGFISTRKLTWHVNSVIDKFVYVKLVLND